MIKGYSILNNGVIKQDVVNKIKYDYQYVNNYNQYKEKTINMAHLRLGYLLGVVDTPINKILDVGYGNGEFIKLCTNYVPKCYGYDITDYHLEHSKVEIVNDIYQDEYDVVCFFDVLEHFEDIYEINKLKTKFIYVSLPECHNFNDEWFEKWKHRKPNEHLFHFNKESLEKFMSEIGFSLVKYSNVEDIIRKPIDNHSNILTGIFKRNS